jgi:hypothetical protein
MKLRYLAAIVLLWGCGDDASGGIDAGGGGTDAGGADAEPRLDAGDDDPDAGPHNCEGVWLERIEGTVVDEDGVGVEAGRAQACLRLAPSGTLVCLAPPLTEADGSYAIDVTDRARCVQGAVLRALKPDAPYATSYCHVDVGVTADALLAVPEPTILYRSEPPATLPPLGDETARRTVVFEDGLEIDVVPEALGFGVDYEALGARRIPVDGELPCFARGVAGLEGLYAFLEEGQIEGAGFAFRIPNATGLAAGTEVELLVLGGLDTRLADGSTVEEADFAPFGTGVVSADGSHIAAEALSYFTWLGYRVVP